MLYPVGLASPKMGNQSAPRSLLLRCHAWAILLPHHVPTNPAHEHTDGKTKKQKHPTTSNPNCSFNTSSKRNFSYRCAATRSNRSRKKIKKSSSMRCDSREKPDAPPSNTMYPSNKSPERSVLNRGRMRRTKNNPKIVKKKNARDDKIKHLIDLSITKWDLLTSHSLWSNTFLHAFVTSFFEGTP